MALSFKKERGLNYLVNNPIVVELISDVQDMIRFEVSTDGIVFYTGIAIPTGSSGNFEANISISEILKSYMKSREVVDMEQLVSPVTNSFVGVAVRFIQGSSILFFQGNIFRGGIGKNLLRYLKGKNTDIFAYKLENNSVQFFMTTRTSGRHITVKENELCPFFFIAGHKLYTAVTEYGNAFTFPAIPASYLLYALNIEVLRQLSYTAYGKIPSYIAIHVDGAYIFDITIKKPSKSPNKYIIQFLNSYSVFEKLEVVGKQVSEPEFAEDNAFMIYDSGIDDYIEQNNRLGIREVIKADFGYKSLEEFLFMRDMLQSDKRYLIGPDGNKQEVRVSCESFSHDLFPTEPGSVSLIIRFIDSDSNYSPPIDEYLQYFNIGEAIWERGVTNGYGFLYANEPLNTI
jgi:hypothetical protein